MESKIDVEQLLFQRLILKLSYDKIAENMGVDRTTVMKHVKRRLNEMEIPELDIKNRIR